MRKRVNYIKTFSDSILAGIVTLLSILLLMLYEFGNLRYPLLIDSIFIIVAFISYLIARRRKQKQREAIQNHKAFLMIHGVTIKVDLSKCDILENRKTVFYDRSDVPVGSFTNTLHRPESDCANDLPEQIVYSQQYNALDDILFPDLAQEKKSYNRTTCFVGVAVLYKGQKIMFMSEPIPMDRMSLEMHLAVNAQDGFIYINPQRKEDYYFDLDFLLN